MYWKMASGGWGSRACIFATMASTCSLAKSGISASSTVPSDARIFRRTVSA